MNITVIPNWKIEDDWNIIEPFLQRVMAVANDEATIDGIKQRLVHGQEGLVAAFEDDVMVGICVVGTRQFETGKTVMEMPYISGNDLNTWLEAGFKVIKQLAREMGCTHIRGCGRPGWERAFPTLKKIATVYEVEV